MNFLDSAPEDSALGGEAAAQGEAEGASFLVFRVGETLWAVPALTVTEMHAMPQLLPLPDTAHWVLGMFNLRGAITPVMDLNARLSLPTMPLSTNDKVVVLRWKGGPIAIRVHEVRSVSRIPNEKIDPPPAHGRQSGRSTPFFAGVTQIDDETVLLLDLPHLLDFNLESEEFSPQAPLESAEWTSAQHEILKERALRLRQITLPDSHNDDFEEDRSGGEKRSPVAVFTLGGDEFAASLEVVREFASVTAVAKVPCCPPHILGQINLRGDIVTLLDVRQTLHTTQTSPPFFEASTESHVGRGARAVSVVVVEHQGAAVGIAVDEVKDVLYLRPEEWSALESSRREGGLQSIGQGFFARGAVYRGRLLPLLDINKLLCEGGLEVDQSA